MSDIDEAKELLHFKLMQLAQRRERAIVQNSQHKGSIFRKTDDMLWSDDDHYWDKIAENIIQDVKYQSEKDRK